MSNIIKKGKCVEVLSDMPAGCADLVFTSPPYYNARKEYSIYENYKSYLLDIKRAIVAAHRVLKEGRFFVINISHVLIPRKKRGEPSKRIPLPFDLHNIFMSNGFDFIEDIHWVKPEGAGWATGRGQRFAKDRNALQYQPVPVTEYILVYRKSTKKNVGFFIKTHHDQAAVKNSKIKDGYDTTNIWKIQPVRNAMHPAVFPVALAEKVIRYYSFENDTVLDPFAGSGTTGKAALNLKRKFILIEKEKKYVELIKKRFEDEGKLK